MAPASTVLTQYTITEEEKLFPAILAHLQRLYPEVYDPEVFLGRAPACREFPLREDGEGLSGDSINSFNKLGSYAGRFDNLSPIISRINNHRPV